MKWKHPPRIKFYEALGAVADGRVHVSGTTAKVYSSSGNKYYDVSYDPDTHAIMANDNGSYWQGYLGYPAIAFLFMNGDLPYNAALASSLSAIPWKDLNVKYKNDFTRTLASIENDMEPGEKEALTAYVTHLEGTLAALDLEMLGKRAKPPSGY